MQGIQPQSARARARHTLVVRTRGPAAEPAARAQQKAWCEYMTCLDGAIRKN